MIYSAAEFLKFLQACTAPVVIISGIGLLLLSVTNRLGRAIDRTRQIKAGLSGALAPEASETARKQLDVLFARCRILQWSVGFICGAITAASLLIAALALMQMVPFTLVPLALALFFAALLSIVLSSVLFLWDVILSLRALEIEVGKG